MKGLMPAAQRWLAPVILAALLAPSLGMLFAHPQLSSTLEKRLLAPPPAWPSGPAGWLAFPRAADAYLQDHFAFRSFLTTQGNRLRWRLGAQVGGGPVVRGRGDWLFLRDSLLLVTGGETQRESARDYANFVCGVDRRLRARGAPLVFSMAPSPATIYPEALPAWVPRGRPSSYDLILDRVRGCGVNAVDLRPPLLAAKPGGSIYYHRDTHWTDKGALIAYNRLVQAMGRPDWVVRAGLVTWRRQPEDRADLAALAGLNDLQPPEMTTPEVASSGRPLTRVPVEGLADPMHLGAFVEQTGHPGPTVLVIGDSFSADFLPAYFAAHVGRFAWIHHQWCGFDWNVFDAVRPDYVVLMPTDRWGGCRKHARPSHMPAL
jgi:alginate O-acetyltransferase complex protein AlgJ